LSYGRPIRRCRPARRRALQPRVGPARAGCAASWRPTGATSQLPDDAHDRTRTCTPFLALVPQTSLSTNFSTWACKNKVLGEGLEPSQDYSHRILNPARLPIPPSERVLAAAAVRSASGAEGNRTPDLLNAIQALSQLSYSPNQLNLCFCGASEVAEGN
jgi:hypothetical protein